MGKVAVSQLPPRRRRYFAVMASLRVDRLNLLVGGELRGSAASVARRSGISPSQMSRYRSGERDPSLQAFSALCRALGVSADWLLGLDGEEPDDNRPPPPEDSGCAQLSPDQLRALEAGVRGLVELTLQAGGDPLPDELGDRRTPITASDAAGSPSAPTDPDWPDESPGEYLEAPYASEVRASAGRGEWVFEESADFRVRLRRSALPRWVNTGNLVCIRVSGDSMEPGIRDGDLLAIDHSRIEPTDNRKFAVSTDDGLVVKRLRRTGAGWELASDNPRRASGNRPMGEDDRIVGQVAWNGPPLPGMVAARGAID